MPLLLSNPSSSRPLLHSCHLCSRPRVDDSWLRISGSTCPVRRSPSPAQPTPHSIANSAKPNGPLCPMYPIPSCSVSFSTWKLLPHHTQSCLIEIAPGVVFSVSLLDCSCNFLLALLISRIFPFCFSQHFLKSLAKIKCVHIPGLHCTA